MSCREKQEMAKVRDAPKLFRDVETGSATVFHIWSSEDWVVGITMMDETEFS